MLDTSPAHDRLRVLTDEDADGYTLAEGDCNDHDPAVHPDAVDDCDGADTNCDGRIDEVGLLEPLCRDDDGDGHGDPATASSACELAEGRVALCDDCDDHDSDVSPAAAERCDGFDNNCDEQVDGDDAVDRPTWYRDEDLDGYGDDGSTIRACDVPPGYIAEPGDCDDREESVNPGAEEVCGDGEDTNCDGDVSQCGLWGDAILDSEDVDPGEGGYIRGEQPWQFLGFSGTLVVDTLGDGSGDVVLMTPASFDEAERLDLWYSAPVGDITPSASHLTVRSATTSYQGYCGTLPLVDADDDGAPELLICAPRDLGDTSDGGRVYEVPVGQTGELILGPESVVLADGVHRSFFGMNLATSSSIAGRPALLVSSYADTASTEDEGLVRAFDYPLSGVDAPVALLEGAGAGDCLGCRHMLSADVDADGYDDVLATTEPVGGALGGSVRVFRGPLPERLSGDDADLWIEAPSLEYVGFDLATHPDLDGDGVAEIFVGSALMPIEGDEHVSSWLAGNLIGHVNLITNASLIWTTDPEDDTRIETATGDINGDGVWDLVAGASALDGERGALYGYYGPLRLAGREDFSAQASFLRRGDEQFMALGVHPSLGDVDADGADDLLFYAGFQPDEGYGGAWFLFGEGI